jgi:hypothetical protein
MRLIQNVQVPGQGFKHSLYASLETQALGRTIALLPHF